MSTLEKAMNLLQTLPERDIETVYSYIQFVSMQKKVPTPMSDAELDAVFDNIIGSVPDSGKTLEEYRAERMSERYGITD